MTNSELKPKLLTSGVTFLTVTMLFVLFSTAGQPAVVAGSSGMSEKDRYYAVKHLLASRQKFLNAVAGLSEEQLRFKAAPDRWSIADVVEHLTLAEDVLFGIISEKVLKTPATPDKERKISDEIVLAVVVDRTAKAQAPEPAKPTGKWAKVADALKEYEQRRTRNIAFVENTQVNLRDHFAPFGNRGEIDALQWVLVLSAHTERHTAQIYEVRADPKFPQK